MERDEMPKTLCRSGCGFYGSSATDGLCSICFKDALKKKCVPNQASSTGSSSGGATPINSSSSSSTSSTTSSTSSSSSGSSADPPPTTTNISQTAILTLSGVETSSSTATVTASAIIDVVTQSIPGPSVSIAQPPEEEDKKPTKTKNRCDTCKKKVGLTGFDCRCGGIFCSLHRYSDKHDCSFNYREQGAAEIRRNNPQIMGQKINKI